MKKAFVSKGESVSRELSLHPVHLTTDDVGNLPPSALIPFCSYQEDSSLLGQERPGLDNLTICDKFQPTILEGQLCYSLDVVKYKSGNTEAGKRNGLFILVDYNPYPENSRGNNVEAERNDQESF